MSAFPSFNERLTAGDGQLVSFAVKAGSTAATIALRLDLSFPVTQVADAKLIEPVVPGAIGMYTFAEAQENNRKFSLTTDPNITDCSFDLKGAVADDGVQALIFSGKAAIRRMTYRASKVGTALIVRVSAEVPHEALSVVSPYLGSSVHFVLNQQNLLPFSGKAPIALRTGDIVTYTDDDGNEVTARFHQLLDDGDVAIVTSEVGEEAELDPASITSSFKLSSDPNDESKLKSLFTKCVKNGTRLSYARFVVEAMGAGTPPPSGFAVTDEFAKSVVSKLRAEKGGDTKAPKTTKSKKTDDAPASAADDDAPGALDELIGTESEEAETPAFA